MQLSIKLIIKKKISFTIGLFYWCNFEVNSIHSIFLNTFCIVSCLNELYLAINCNHTNLIYYKNKCLK